MFCTFGERQIYLKKENDRENSDRQVLGIFDLPALYCWTFDAEQKQLRAGLGDATVALISIMDK